MRAHFIDESSEQQITEAPLRQRVIRVEISHSARCVRVAGKIVEQHAQTTQRESTAPEIEQIHAVVTLQVCFNGVAVLVEQSEQR